MVCVNWSFVVLSQLFVTIIVLKHMELPGYTKIKFGEFFSCEWTSDINVTIEQVLPDLAMVLCLCACSKFASSQLWELKAFGERNTSSPTSKTEELVPQTITGQSKWLFLDPWYSKIDLDSWKDLSQVGNEITTKVCVLLIVLLSKPYL